MQFGKSLVGALIGAAVGIAMLVAVYLTTGRDWVWLVIPFAILTGIGVRMLVGKSSGVSIARGALTMIIAIAAYIGGWTVVTGMLTAKANAASSKVPAGAATEPAAGEAAATEDDSTATDEKKAEEGKEETPATDEEKKTEEAPKAAPQPRPKQAAQPTGAKSTIPMGKGATYGVLDIVCLAVAALVAYQLGRGSGNPAPAASTSGSAPMSVHPDA